MSQPFEDPYLNTYAGKPDSSGFTRAAFKDARRILALPDSAVQELKVRKSGLRTFVVDGATVSGPHGKSGRFVCFTHRVNDCSHTRRVKKWIEGRAA